MSVQIRFLVKIRLSALACGALLTQVKARGHVYRGNLSASGGLRSGPVFCLIRTPHLGPISQFLGMRSAPIISSSPVPNYAADLFQTLSPPMSATWICRGVQIGDLMELHSHPGDPHEVGSTAGIGQEFRLTEIQLWALCRSSRMSTDPPLKSLN